MRFGLVSGALCVGVLAVSCKARTYGTGETQGVNGADTGAGSEINARAFNAFVLWRDGNNAPLLFNYHTEYNLLTGSMAPDGAFFVPAAEYWKDNRDFIGSTTTGARVENDVLVYSTRKGHTLRLKFSAPSGNRLTQLQAAEFCTERHLRLPTVQEIFDFCAAGSPKNAEGRYTSHRCGTDGLWSASVNSENRANAWQFNGRIGNVNAGFPREEAFGAARCVGKP